MAKLTGVSFGGEAGWGQWGVCMAPHAPPHRAIRCRPRAVGALIKYGSLLAPSTDSIPFAPSPTLALIAIALPPAVYAVRWLISSASR